MSIDSARVRGYIRVFDFRKLFIDELGWDNLRVELPVDVDGHTYRPRGVAHKRGLAVFHLETAEFPPGPLRNKIETRVAKTHPEHILVFSDAARTRQTWLRARREPGRPLVRRSFDYHAGQSGEALAQHLDDLAFTLAEEEKLTLVDVVGRVRAAFKVEPATKKFYDEFRKERDAFETFVKGIPDADMSRWYVSVMLNRLMFVYFIQKKGFLDGDTDYLRNRLAATRAARGEDQFGRFYRYFLLRLFHDGLGRPDRDPALEALIGRVPYLNGGIFQPHQVEQKYPDIDIRDEAFERIFDFFDGYQWHLDDRPLGNDNEINPDVLGYIFEKYINQKQMGAYYTKEDITEYISKNTIIPFLFDRARGDCKVAFEGEASVWSLAAADPDRYIHEAVRKGTELPLPPEIAAGIDDVGARTLWNTPTPDEYALPTEIWRETVARRQRCEEVRLKLAGGEIRDVNEFITFNLDIRQFAQDVIEQAEGADLLAAFWGALSGVSVLDPTCGSGAFLFAALNVLEPLYEAAIARMREFTADEGWQHLHRRYAERFGAVLADIERHPNETYFIQKSIIVNNLYGVDIMEEAVEIAKLRLFLKLASQLERVDQVEPLPDIDFNIRAGNTLVGYVKREEVRDALTVTRDAKGGEQRNLLFGETSDALAAVEEQAADIDRLYGRFRAMMTGQSGGGSTADDLAATKAEMRRRLGALNDTLDRALARQYGEGLDKGAAFDKWRAGHQPFHWFTEFYGILQEGGFDVVVGNPPYVEYKEIRQHYTVQGFATEACGNLYAYVVERSFTLLSRNGMKSMIIPHSAICTDRMEALLELFKSHLPMWVSTYSIRPSKLFDGADQRLVIYISGVGGKQGKPYINSTQYLHWSKGYRDFLFSTLHYADVTDCKFSNSIPKLNSPHDLQIWTKLNILPKLGRGLALDSNHRKVAFFHNAPRYWIRAVDFEPYFWNERDGEKLSTQMRPISLETDTYLPIIVGLLNSSLFYWWFVALSDCRHLNLREIVNFPVDLNEINDEFLAEMSAQVGELMASYQENAKRKQAYYKATGSVKYDEFYPRFSKNIIDQIDTLLAQHYHFTPAELDYIINYDIKYRMGSELNAGEGSDEND